VALFCCLAGTTAAGPSGATWGAAHWQQFLLLLHAAKQLTGGLWKGLLREWAGAGGAQLPLQCVLDLLGNVYNASSLLALDQQPALLGSKLALLQATQQQHQQGQGQPSQLQQQQQVDSVSGALRELLVDGPLGPASAVDFDELLAMLMLQFDAGGATQRH
jgi:hypothetical protein